MFRVIPVLSDNLAYVVTEGHRGLVIDPGDAEPVITALAQLGVERIHVLLTHEHADHTAGVDALRQRHADCRVTGLTPLTGSAWDANGRCQIETPLGPVLALRTPGHTASHCCFLFPVKDAHSWLFSGDTLFGGGCGRVGNGAYAALWQSLQRLRALPPETRVCFGHEYTLDNLAFAAAVEPDNPAIPERIRGVRARRVAGQPSAPSTLCEELATNPFLRADAPELRLVSGCPDADPLAVFTFLRRWKDTW